MYEARDLGFKSCSSGFVVPVATSRTKGDSKPGLKPVSILVIHRPALCKKLSKKTLL
jgi:hypothetical protein